MDKVGDEWELESGQMGLNAIWYNEEGNEIYRDDFPKGSEYTYRHKTKPIRKIVTTKYETIKARKSLCDFINGIWIK